ncbi:helix-turn-helix domain-containing protein [Heyndrickxia sporothermodurans]|uniref:helix-turn-helix domain-containing protein n=1 Tax=Heyndrickxia sporothermodurans TaxID=46224 RepID=UPI00192C065E|nr:helix-turn-helix domain-containing protein [Heyndrickxia sporothermodurans]MBL5834071.1 helix-turn-helix domain-containing protein [Heyndrickxia sporothermodurans]
MYNLLIADKDEFEAKGMKWLIESSISNVNVKLAHNLIDSVMILENEQPDIFIYETNIGIGEELLKAIKINQPNIISITMEATFEAAKKAIDIGTKFLLIKPFSPQELLNNINLIIRELERQTKDKLERIFNTDKQNVVYEHLFLDESSFIEPYVFVAFQPEKVSILPKLNQYLKEYLFPITPMIFPLSDMTICLFNSQAELDWNSLCKRFMYDWDQFESESIVIIINLEENPYLSLHEKYLHTKKMTEVTFFVGYRQVLEFTSELQWKFIDPFLTPSEQKQWISYLNEGNKEEISSFLSREFLQFTDPFPDPSLLRIRLTSILAQIRRHMKSTSLDHKLYEEEYLTIFDTILYESIIFRIIQKLIIFTSKIIDAAADISKNSYTDTIEKCIKYMELNYWKKDFALSDLSTFVGRNSTYLSHLFVEKTKKIFRECLTDIRIKEAKKLLIETDMVVKEIASLTGFQNQYYFSRVFKNSVGMPPKQFRTKESLEHFSRS